MGQSFPLNAHPDSYVHWRLSVDGELATLGMDVQEDKGLGDYVLKLNSYDIGVDVELADAIQRIRFEHPQVKCVVLTGLKDKTFCAGANIFMLGQSSHAFKVNFCKFTNETRLGIEDASASSEIKFLAALNGTASGGGYELALACDEILLIDDRNSAVSFPEVPLLAVLPGTGGLTRVTDKRMVRKDIADYFSTVAEGVKGKRAVQYKLVDAVVPKSSWDAGVQKAAKELALTSNRDGKGAGVKLPSIHPEVDGNALEYQYVTCVLDEKARTAELTISGPTTTQPKSAEKIFEKGAELWALKAYRELDDAILRLRLFHLDIALVTLKTKGDPQLLLDAEEALLAAQEHWFAREVLHHMKRVLKRVDVTSKTFLALVEPGMCWAGSLAELIWIADRSYMLDDEESQEQAKIMINELSRGLLPTANGLSRLKTRFWGDEPGVKNVLERVGKSIEAEEAEELGVVTFVRDDIDYPDETRLFIEERTSLSPDALTGMEQNLRWPGPETMETRIFGRLSAWQNWIFTRKNATGEHGALTVYGSPDRPEFETQRC